MKTFYTNLSITKKVNLSLLLLVVLCLTGAGTYSYISIFNSVETMLGEKLSHIATTASMMIDAGDHQKIENAYAEEKTNIDQMPEFKRIQAILREVKSKNNLVEEIYTVIAPDWADGHMIFMTMTNEKSYIGNTVDVHELVKKTLVSGQTQFSKIYRDSEGVWVSAFAPIVDKTTNKAVGVLEFDYKANRDILAAQITLLKSIGIPAVFAVFMSLIFGFLISKALTKSITSLADAASKVSKGNLNIKIINNSNDEIGVLAQTFNSMIVDLKASKEKLEDYAKNLESKVEERTAELAEAMQDIKTLLNNLGQGFMVIEKNGTINKGSTKSTCVFFGADPTGKHYTDVLQLSDSEVTTTKDWINLCFENAIDFNTLATLGPTSFTKLNDKFIELSYRQVLNQSGQLEKLICIAEDKSHEKTLERRALEESEFAKFVSSVVKDKAGFNDFTNLTFKTAEEVITTLKKCETTAHLDIDLLFRHFHTIKGEASCYHVLNVKESAHNLENLLSNFNNEADPEQFSYTIKELQTQCESLATKFNEFLETHQDILGKKIDSKLSLKAIDIEKAYDLGILLKNKLGSESKVYCNYLNTFLIEDLALSYDKFVSLIQNLALKQGKKINFTLDYNQAFVVASEYKNLVSSSVHLFRNVVDHGIETCDERTDSGKSEAGNVSLKFNEFTRNEERFLRITLIDDGYGVDPAIIRSKILEKGLKSKVELAAISDNEVIQFIFLPQFTSKNEVTDISGRGVGLDSCSYEVQKFNGKIWVESTVGYGSQFIIEVPYIVDLPDATQFQPSEQDSKKIAV